MTHRTHPAADRALDPGREGSAACCAVLAQLFRTPGGLSLPALCGFLDCDERTVRAALIGLSERRRIRCIGKGQASRWYTMAHATAAEGAL